MINLKWSLLDELEAAAKDNPRLRLNLDLRTSPSDGSQRMLNVLLPGTVLPIHRHMKSIETVIVIRGELTEVFYNDDGTETDRFVLSQGSDSFGIQIPVGQWHNIIVNEPCVIVEVKDGPYEPLSQDDILNCDTLRDKSAK